MSNSSTIMLEEKEHKEHKDRLSALTNDTLRFILSLMDTRDATRTCILSKRWQFLATNLTNINFGVPETLLLEYKSKGKPPEDVTQNFLDWVNRVVTCSRAPFINEFRICFPLDYTHSKYVDMWIKFAVSKQVQKLELDFRAIREFTNSGTDGPYVLKSKFFYGISNLASLCLKEVKLSQKVLDSVLSRCHLLERLHIAYPRLSKLKIINLSGKLKYLIVDCAFLKELEIHAVNLVSFSFSSILTTKVVYASVPSLVEAHFHGGYSYDMLPKFSPIRSFSHQLSTLSILVDATSCEDFEENLVIPSFPNVQDLTLQVPISDRSADFLWLACFPEACPLLRRFKLEVGEISKFAIDSESEDYSSEDANSSEDAKEGYGSLEEVKQWLENQEDSNTTLPNLQKIEWTSKFATNVDKEYMLALYLVKNAIKLKTFIFNPRYSIVQFYNGDKLKFNEEDVEAIREHAQQLAMIIPSHIDIVIM